MKTIEQKAKAYDEAIGKLQGLIDNANKQGHIIIHIEDIENSFPELKESEDDSIRKDIIRVLKGEISFTSGKENEKYIAWLEKQGSYTKKDVDDAYLKGISDAKNEIEKQYEASYQIRKDIATFIFNYRGDLKDRTKWMHYLGIRVSLVKNQDEKNSQPSLILKSALEAAKEEKVDNQNCVKPDKNEPEFHEGEWVVYNHDICQIVKREEGCNKLVTVFGIEKELVNERNLSTAHLWTIQDAKDGDVLVASDGSIFLFAGVVDCACKYYAVLTAYNEVKIKKEVYDSGYWETSRAVRPATKEQRDLLFSKMKEAGYEWDADKKELKKIERKSTWSEEDKHRVKDIIYFLDTAKKHYASTVELDVCIDWLKSLKERIGG